MPRRSAARAGMALILVLAAIVLAGGLALYLQTRAAALSRSALGEHLKYMLGALIHHLEYPLDEAQRHVVMKEIAH